MSFKFNAIMAAAMTLIAATSAHANFQFGDSTTNGNSSAAFVAIDNGGNVSLSLDLGTTLTSFLPAISGVTSGAGNLSSGGTTASWNFATNTYTINGVQQAGNTFAWSSPAASFFANSAVTGNSYQWGVIAADGVFGSLSATNVVQGGNLLWTSTSDNLDFSSAAAGGVTNLHVNNAAGAVTNYFANNNQTGTNTTTVKGGSTSTGGQTFLGYTLAQNNIGDFGGGSPGNNNFLVDPTATSYAMWANSVPAVTLYTLGGNVQAGSLSASASTFTWDQSTSTLTYTVGAVPEPQTYALMIAGLGLVGAMVRRRKTA